MSGSEPLLDRAAIEEVLRKLGDRLASRGVVADIYVVGGAAMALAYDARRSTRDIDAVFEPHGIVLEEVRAVARELGLPQWWLNEQASVYVAPGGDPAATRVFDHPGLRVSAASPEHLRLDSAKDVLSLCADVFPEEPVPDRARLILEDLFEDD
ncbi:DUF6036 family nucleotidyltransferase [Actinomadura chibensis]|uniref:Nucleotidyl transferase n=1 Tax=Actinomadura chibensis TaxID=392828 RepID=A0A5D0NWP4_9ACTN|nr:DUF6036 family nucleotidyltransferase [Actinomadura chibensis]TYB49093.1 hypothetical protein FXF69_08120 [Actinomadura chibensis]